MFSIFIIPILMLMPIGQRINWKQEAMKPLLSKFWLWAVSSLLIAVAIVVMFGDLEPMAVVGTTLGLWVLAGCVKYVVEQGNKGATFKSGVQKISRSYWGMLVAHLGVAVTVLGVVLTSYFSLEENIKISQGQTVQVEDLEVEFYDFKNTEGPNYISSAGSFRIYSEGELITDLHPEKRKYNASRMVMTEADIDAGLFRDIYVVMGEPLDDGAWAISVYYKPFVRWIWLGSIFMALGGLLAISDKRYRQRRREKKQAKKDRNNLEEAKSE
jgi:cytochrome c-type biogenesis protein CcmF